MSETTVSGTGAERGNEADDLGVVVVTYDAGDVIAGCLESLMAAQQDWAAGNGGGRLRVAVVDNASGDDTVEVIRAWASGCPPFTPPATMPFEMRPAARPLTLAESSPDGESNPSADVTLIHSGANRGFAGGVNVGLAHLARDPAIKHFWVLNPDSMVPAASVGRLAAFLKARPDYSMLGGRVIYFDRPDTIQIEGGLLNRWTGVTGNFNLQKPVTSPSPEVGDLDFITGASLVASRAFYEAVGPMQEDYFLYYEEVDWAMRRGNRPLAYCPGFDVYHWGGTAIGSPVVGRSASPFSLYFKHRARIRFQRRFHPYALPVAWAYSLAQAGRTALFRRSPAGGWAIIAASFGLPMPRVVSSRLGPDALAHASGARAARKPAAGRHSAQHHS